MLPNPHYMEIQTEIQWSMRSVLMDWLVQVHNRFSLLPETLFLTVNYIDRFPLLQSRVHWKAAARWRHRDPGSLEVRRDQLPIAGRDYLYGRQRLQHGRDPEG